MANTSGDLALEKIAGTDKAKLFPTPFNQDMEDIDEAITDLTDEKAGSSEIGIVVNGNKTAFPTGAANGQFVILRNSTITGCDDGLYKAAKVIPYDTVIDSTYLTPCPEGAANALNDSLNNSNTSEETVVGTFNGKTLYRKFIQFSGKTGNASIGTISVNPLTVEWCSVNPSYSRIISPSNNIIPIPYATIGSDLASIWITSNGTVMIKIEGYTGSGVVCVEYTKS